MFKFFNKKIKDTASKGFTLVEMTIVTAIFALLTVVVVYKYGDFTSNLLVTNMAYEIALTVRQAQAFGVGVRGFDLDGERTFGYPYGVFFNLNFNDGSVAVENQNRNFIFFIDRDDDKRCGDGDTNTVGDIHCSCETGDECIDRLSLQRNIRITELRVGNTNCVANSAIQEIAVSFKRPSPEARIIRQDSDYGIDDVYGFAQIKIEAPASDINPSYVLIRKNGQISVSGNDICN